MVTRPAAARRLASYVFPAAAGWAAGPTTARLGIPPLPPVDRVPTFPTQLCFALSGGSQQRRWSNKPVDAVYGGPKPAAERMTLRKLAGKHRRGERISVVTAYDYPSAVHVSDASAQRAPSAR